VEGFGEDVGVSLLDVLLSLFGVVPLSVVGVLLVSDFAPSVSLADELVDEESDFPFWA
jgi:hypothetical protein